MIARRVKNSFIDHLFILKYIVWQLVVKILRFFWKLKFILKLLSIEIDLEFIQNKFFCLLIGLIWTGILLFLWITGYGYTNSFNDMISQIPTRDYGIVLDCGSSGTR